MSLFGQVCHAQDSLDLSFFEGTLNGDMHLEILLKVLPTMQAMPNFSDVIFQQDGEPPRYATHVRDFLNATFQEKWVVWRGSIEWPPRSPDLTPMDFFLWGVVKEKDSRESHAPCLIYVGSLQRPA